MQRFYIYLTVDICSRIMLTNMNSCCMIGIVSVAALNACFFQVSAKMHVT